MLPRLHLQSTLRGSLAHTLEHGLGNIRARNSMPQASEVQSGMPTTARDIEHACLRRQRNMYERGLHIADIGEDVAAPVIPALPIELLASRLLDGVQRHGA